jgi:CubicO group peptidase (beta-lactamase class C family)
MTKPITAAAVMALVDDGTLHLDAPVDDLLPELANRRVLRSIDARLDDTVPACSCLLLRHRSRSSRPVFKAILVRSSGLRPRRRMIR